MIVLAALGVGGFVALVVGRIAGVEVRFGRRTRPARVRRMGAWLVQAGSSMSPGQFVAGGASCGLVALVLVGALTGSIAVAFVPAIAVASIPTAVLGKRRRERLEQVCRAWPDGLRDITTSIAAGASITQAIEHLALHGPEPLRVAFARFASLARVLGPVAALEVVREEVGDPTTDRVIEVLVLAHERGGPIVRVVLDDLARATTRDVRLAEEIATEGLEMRINARSVVVIPWAVLVLLCLRPGPFRDFYASGRGAVVLVIGAAMSAIGLIVVRGLGRVPGEPRVFRGTDRT